MDQPGRQGYRLPELGQFFLLRLKLLLVQRVALHQIFAQALGCPDAELRTLSGFHAITDGDNHVKIVVFDLALNLPLAFLSNYPEIPDSCPTCQFALFKCIGNVLVNGTNILIKQLRHLLLRQPDGFPFQSNLGSN